MFLYEFRSMLRILSIGFRGIRTSSEEKNCFR